MFRSQKLLPILAAVVFVVSVISIFLGDIACDRVNYVRCPYDAVQGIGLPGILVAFGLFSIWLLMRLHRTTHPGIVAPLDVLLGWICIGGLLSLFSSNAAIIVYILTFRGLLFWAIWTLATACLCLSKKQHIAQSIFYVLFGLPVFAFMIFMMTYFGDWGMGWVPVG